MRAPGELGQPELFSSCLFPLPVLLLSLSLSLILRLLLLLLHGNTLLLQMVMILLFGLLVVVSDSREALGNFTDCSHDLRWTFLGDDDDYYVKFKRANSRKKRRPGCRLELGKLGGRFRPCRETSISIKSSSSKGNRWKFMSCSQAEDHSSSSSSSGQRLHQYCAGHYELGACLLAG